MMKKIFVIFAVAFITKSFAQAPNWVLFNHTNAPFVNDSITWVEVDTNNVKWVGTQNGLYSFYNNAWTVYNMSNSNIPSNRIDKFKIAYDNTIWFLNHNNGFVKFKNNTFTLINKSNTPTMRTDSLVGLTIDSNEVYFWSNYDGIVRFNGLTNTVYNIDTTNSYLKNIGILQYHNNHTFYGLGNYTSSMQFPQNRKDSINVAVFVITTNPTYSITYCYEPINVSGTGNNCAYDRVYVDKYQNREEFSTINSFGDTKRRLYNKNNTLISNINFNQQPYTQILYAPDGEYRLYRGGLSIESISTPYGYFDITNSIIPDFQILRFDTDKYNNLWLATSKGLVGFNHTGVITNLKENRLSNISIYPNPATDVLNIEFSTSPDSYRDELTEQPITIEITNTLGQLVLSETSISQNLKLKTNNLQSGLYYLNIKTKDKTVTRKIMIQK